MFQFKTIRRVTVYADATLESALLPRFLALGARGYTVTDCRGKGEHETVQNPFSSVHNRVRIELLVLPEQAEKILAFLQTGQFKNQAVTSCMDTVQIAASEHF